MRVFVTQSAWGSFADHVMGHLWIFLKGSCKRARVLVAEDIAFLLTRQVLRLVEREVVVAMHLKLGAKQIRKGYLIGCKEGASLNMA